MNIYFLTIRKLATLLIFSALSLQATSEEHLTTPFNFIDGTSTTLADFKGKSPVYLKFWASWCQPCMKQMPHFEAIQQKYGDKIKVISINIAINDELADVKEVMAKYHLTMPTVMDVSGDLAKAFQFKATPYHLLFDKNLNLLHLGHQANETLDNKIDLVSQQKNIEKLNINTLPDENSHNNIKLDLAGPKLKALFFSATWCDWYFKESRESYSTNCISAQQQVNKLAEQYPNIIWQGVISRLWTGEDELNNYQKRYSLQYPVDIDQSNQWFYNFKVKKLPTLIIIQDKKQLLRITDFSTSNKQLISLHKLLETSAH